MKNAVKRLVSDCGCSSPVQAQVANAAFEECLAAEIIRVGPTDLTAKQVCWVVGVGEKGLGVCLVLRMWIKTEGMFEMIAILLLSFKSP